jgi:hypothetical protein
MSDISRWIELESLLDVALLALSRSSIGTPIPKALFMAPTGKRENEYMVYFGLTHFDGKGDGITYYYYAVIGQQVKGNYIEVTTDNRGTVEVSFTDVVDEAPRKKMVPLVRLKERPRFP